MKSVGDNLAKRIQDVVGRALRDVFYHIEDRTSPRELAKRLEGPRRRVVSRFKRRRRWGTRR